MAHLYANFTESVKVSKYKSIIPEFPAIGLVVSGGHTDLVIAELSSAKSVKVSKHNSIKIRLLGTTRDDAAGECFDKGARLLGLGYPGGPAIAAEAAKLKSIKVSKCKSVKLPRPLINEKTYDFSFSGLKTALARQVAQVAKVEQVVQEMAYEVQEAIVEVLVERVMRAVEEFRPKSVLLGGGVAANLRLRETLDARCQMSDVRLFIPPVELCTDNAVMIGAAALRLSFDKLLWQEVKANPGLEIV